MSADTLHVAPAAALDQRSSFFRQSGWMMLTSVGSGVLMSLVHILSKFVPNEEYAAFGALLQLLNWITIPVIGLQVTIAQQTSAVVSAEGRRQLAATIRFLAGVTFGLWLALAAAILALQPQLLRWLQLANPAALWVTLVLGLVMFWLPLTQGLLQGRQNFLWLGWASVANGGGRLLLAVTIVLVLGGWAAGIMTGALLGAAAALAIGLWQNRDVLTGPGERFAVSAWFRRLLPLSLGCGVSQFLFSADVLFVQATLADTAPYIFGGTLARALVLFTAPLVAVMFPKLVHSAVRNRKSDVMALTLGLTALLALVGVAGISLGAPWLIRLGSKPEFLSFLPLMPLFALAMAPLAIGNVLLNHLMAHSRFRCVPALLVVAAGYWLALRGYGDSFRSVILVLGLFNLLFLGVCAFFTWFGRDRPALPRPAGETA